MKIFVADINQIHNARAEWNALVQTMQLPSIFLTWEWVTTWIKQFGKNYELFVLMGYENDELICILPLAKRKMRLEDGLLTQRVITFCGAIELYPDHLDIICSKDTDDEKILKYIDELINFIYLGNTMFDVVMLPYLAENGYLSRWVQAHTVMGRMIRAHEVVAPYTPIEGSINNLLQGMGKKKRYNLKREVRILLEQKDVHMSAVLDSEDVSTGLSELIRLHTARSDQKGIDSTFVSTDILQFHHEFIETASEHKWVRLYQLVNNSNVIASAYGFLFQDRFHYYQTGFDPTWSNFSPGNVMIYLMIDQLSQDGAKEFDFLGGNDSYKYFWTKKHRLMPTYLLFNKGIFPTVEYHAMEARRILKKIIKWVMLQWDARLSKKSINADSTMDRQSESDQ